jgi:two-component system LytT family response regulator
MSQEIPILRCILIDDEPLACGLLAEYIRKVSSLELLGTYNNAMAALADLKRLSVNLVFLDIQMPEINGLQFTQMLPSDCKVIFTTAYPNYALQGFELNAADYLLKPVSFERFLKSVSKVLDMAVPVSGAQPAGIAPVVSHMDEVLFVKTDYMIVKVFLSEILYIEGLKEYIRIHTPDKKIITLQNMKKMEEVLPADQFMRVHKSYIVAINKIDTISKNRIQINKTEIPIGDTYKDILYSFLNNKGIL